jgi:hypothetical protein
MGPRFSLLVCTFKMNYNKPPPSLLMDKWCYAHCILCWLHFVVTSQWLKWEILLCECWVQEKTTKWLTEGLLLTVDILYSVGIQSMDWSKCTMCIPWAWLEQWRFCRFPVGWRYWTVYNVWSSSICNWHLLFPIFIFYDIWKWHYVFF